MQSRPQATAGACGTTPPLPLRDEEHAPGLRDRQETGRATDVVPQIWWDVFVRYLNGIFHFEDGSIPMLCEPNIPETRMEWFYPKSQLILRTKQTLCNLILVLHIYFDILQYLVLLMTIDYALLAHTLISAKSVQEK